MQSQEITQIEFDNKISNDIQEFKYHNVFINDIYFENLRKSIFENQFLKKTYLGNYIKELIGIINYTNEINQDINTVLGVQYNLIKFQRKNKSNL